MSIDNYWKFIQSKSDLGERGGFKPLWMPDFLFDFQKYLTERAIRSGRCAKLADCGLGKSPMELVFAENIVRKTNKRVLIATPLAVAQQMVGEGEKFGVDARRSYKGELPKSKIVVTNYDRLHYFNPRDFEAFIGDESSCLKAFDGERQKEVSTFCQNMRYRLFCTATPAPNDFIELLTTAEALGEMGRMDALGTYFRNDENSLHPIWWGARWRFKAHAEEHFWRWVCSWAMAVRKPSDLGFSDRDFKLPPLEILQTVVEAAPGSYEGFFPMPARTLKEQNDERKKTIKERCEIAAQKAIEQKCSVLWCHRNNEGDLLEKLVPGARQITGENQSEEEREEILMAFAKGELTKLVSKPSITGFGLNWQHCNHMTMFPDNSFEQYYQAVRRLWRFGQKRKVTVDLVTTPGQMGMLRNLQRKSVQADKIFDSLIKNMHRAMHSTKNKWKSETVEIPEWL